MQRQPNVILVVTDDQGYGDIGCHGNPWLDTPNLDRLARESVRLDNHHHDPLCSPSRAALLTGQYAARNGVWHVIQGRHLLHPDAVTLADLFRANGYRTGMFGKWHLGDNYPFAPRFRGFDDDLCHRGGGVGELPDFWGNSYLDDTYFRKGAPEACRGYCTDVFFAAACEFIAGNAETPFFMYLATNAMHGPHIVPSAYATPYSAQGVPDERAKFYGMIANFDENMGRLMACLEEWDLDEDTIVIFTADHGTAAGFDPESGTGFNAGLRGKKGSVYDGGHQVSFFLRWRNQLPANRRLRDLTAHIDVLPTLVDLCQLSRDAGRESDGLSLAGVMRGEEQALPERSVVIQLQPDIPEKWHHNAVIKDSWRLINGMELYNVENDRAQQVDVAAENRAIVAALRQDYELWWRDLRDCFTQIITIPVGTDHENPVNLSARDWRPTEGRVPWMQSWIDDPAFDSNGFWMIEVVESGRYSIELRAHPREASRQLSAGSARLNVGGLSYTSVVTADEDAAAFFVNLSTGVARLQTWLVDADAQRERGAYYVAVQKL